MQYPALTSVYAAILALIFAAVSIWVSQGRGQFKILHGDGGNSGLQRRIRAHANFAEYVPLIVVLVALLEAGGAPRAEVHALLAPLVIARAMHPVGMVAGEGAPQQYLFRGVGATVTVLVMVAASVLLLARAL
jgi:uncharacterized membrane protein YecN with MAPEG domain